MSIIWVLKYYLKYKLQCFEKYFNTVVDV